MTLSLLVPQEALDKVLKRLGKLAKTAGVSIDILPGSTTLIKGTQTLTCSRITIGEMPSVGGYEFAARIEHTKEGNIIVRGPSETQDLDLSWRRAEPRCDHCEKKRARKETFLLRQYGVALLQIGRNCLADFLMTDPSKMVALAELVKAIGGEMDDERWGSYGNYWEVSPLAFIACAVSSTERHGFRKTSEEMPTRCDAEFLSNPCPSRDARLAKIWHDEQPTEDQIETAHQIVAWAANPPDNASEYSWNLSLAVKQAGVGKHGGLLASAPAAFSRHLGREVQKKLKPTLVRPEGYAVEQGEIFKGEATLIRHFLVESPFGSKAICTFRTDDGHEIVWFASGVAPKPDMQGLRFQLKGRCKKHDSYKGVNQTILQRVTWKPVETKEESKAS